MKKCNWKYLDELEINNILTSDSLKLCNNFKDYYNKIPTELSESHIPTTQIVQNYATMFLQPVDEIELLDIVKYTYWLH